MDIFYTILGYAMFVIWIYNYVCVFKNKKNIVEVIFGILGAILLVLYIIGSTAMMYDVPVAG